jgi:hypothetical protein
VFNAETEEELDGVPNPPCPKCAKKPRRTDVMQQATPPIPHDGLDGIIEQQRAPGINGQNAMVSAIDKTAEIVMADHHLTNLKDNIRQGDIMAPALRPDLQKKADGFWGTGTVKNRRQQAQMQNMMRRAIGGAYRASALDVKSVLPDARVALRKVGVEPAR